MQEALQEISLLKKQLRNESDSIEACSLSLLEGLFSSIKSKRITESPKSINNFLQTICVILQIYIQTQQTTEELSSCLIFCLKIFEILKQIQLPESVEARMFIDLLCERKSKLFLRSFSD